jgi:cell division initiation protein
MEGILKITPLEINKQEFKKSMRGYDPIEVDTFLELLGSEYEKLLNTNKTYEKKVIELETELKNYKEVERTLKQTLMNVQETSDKSRENLKKEANLIRKEAELSAAEILENARRETQTLKEEMITLKTQKQSLITRLRHVLTSQLELIDVLDLDDVDLSKLKDRTKKVFSNVNKQQEYEKDKEIAIKNSNLESEVIENPPKTDMKSKKDILNNLFDGEIDIGDSKP